MNSEVSQNRGPLRKKQRRESGIESRISENQRFSLMKASELSNMNQILSYDDFATPDLGDLQDFQNSEVNEQFESLFTRELLDN